MATKKTKKKKVIDGVVKNTKKKSPTKKSNAPKVKTPKSEKVEKVERIKASPEDVTVTIVETDESGNKIEPEATDDVITEAIVDEPAIEIDEIAEDTSSSTEESPKDEVESDTKESTEENIVIEEPTESEPETEPESELASESKPEVIKIEVETPETTEEAEEITEEIAEEESEDSTDETNAIDDGENLAMNGVLSEEAIDENLDELINDIEKDEKKEAKEKATSSSKKSIKKECLKQEKAKPTALPFRIISRILAILSLGAVTSAIIRIILTGIMPNKYLIPAVAILALFFIFYVFKTWRRKTHIPVLIILTIIGIALGSISVFGFVKVQETMNFLFNNFNESKEYTIYNIIVSNKSSYNSLNDVKGKTFHSISDFVNTERLETAARDQANASISYEDGISSLLKNTYADTAYIAVLNAGTWDATINLNDGKNDYVGKYKVIGELKVEEEKKNEAVESNLSTESFTVFVSGIDTRTGLMLDRSLSDVNMIITVNPKTKHILMTTIPRDYYVQLHGTSGLRDKLTHAGSLGGIELSMDTIEDLLDFEFSRYIRVNFNFVISLVNAVGGITLYSDVNYNVTAHTNHACVFHPGDNQVDGTCALAFARERYAYADGDRHRGRNQEQVIEKIFQKLTSSTTLISRYSDILNSLNGSFDTNISASDITSLANMQLNDMASWTVETYNCDGSTGGAYTYSYPNQTLSVMYPDETTVETAKKKIKQVLAGTTEAAPTETTETTVQE